MLKKLSVRSPWLFRINAGSCNGCDVELATTACIPRYDVERLGCRYCGSPRHADIVLITGPLTTRVRDRVLRVWDEIPEPKVTVAVGIGLQNFPEGAAVSLPLRREGCSRRKSFFIGQASGFVEPIAGVLGALLAVYIEAVLPFALSFAAGAMILVAVHELIPECQRNQKAQPYAATMGIVTGFALMMLLDVMLG